MAERRLTQEYGMGEEDRRRRKEFLGLTPQEERDVSRLKDHFEAYGAEFADRFYAHLLSHPETAKFLEDPALVERLKETQREYFEQLLEGLYDESYFEGRLRVGETHERSGVGPAWYLAAYNLYIQICFPYLAHCVGEPMSPTLLSVMKVIFLDITLALETYFAAATQRLRQRNVELKEALSLYWEAERKARQYSKLAGHEIRGGLNAIAATCDVLLEEFGSEMNADSRQMVEAMHQRCWKIFSIAEDILQQPESAGQRSWVETAELLKEARSRIDVYRSDRPVELVLPPNPPRVLADPIGLREVFANLISNAVRHLDRRAGRIEVKYRSDGADHVFCVADNGPGIPREMQRRVFEPFFQVPQASPSEGRGLGLHFVRTIVEQHGGRVWVESTPGEGSRFYFTIPKSPPPATAAASEDER